MKFLLFLLIISNSYAAERRPNANVPHETLERLKKLYPQEPESFILERLHKAPTAFDKWRAFPAYYYDLLGRLSGVLGNDFFTRQGLCAGDPHLENFGFLFLGKTVFTINDLDDVSPCPLNADAMRLFVGHRLLGKLPALEFLNEYKAGLAELSKVFPDALKDLEKESLKGKTGLAKKYMKLLKGKCDGDFSEPTTDEIKLVQDWGNSEGRKVIKVCTRTKGKGGSAGLKRFISFHEVIGGIEAIELKPLVTPAPFVGRQVSPADRLKMFQEGVRIFLGEGFQVAYYPVNLKGQLYERRPLWAGNVGLDEKDLSSSDLKDVMLFEARVLGGRHRLTNASPFPFSPESWDKAATILEKQWRAEFAE